MLTWHDESSSWSVDQGMRQCNPSTWRDAGHTKLEGPTKRLPTSFGHPVLQLHTLNSKHSLVVMNSLSSDSAMSRICTRKKRGFKGYWCRRRQGGTPRQPCCRHVHLCRVETSCTEAHGQHTYILEEELGQA